MAPGTKWTNDEISALVSSYSEKNVQDCMEEVIQRMKEQWRRKNDATNRQYSQEAEKQLWQITRSTTAVKHVNIW